MRVNESIVIRAPRELVWEQISDGENYLRFMSGITRWEVEGDDSTELVLGSRIRMLIRVGAAEIGGRIEVVEYKPGQDLAWASVTGVDQRGRWRVREGMDGRPSRVELRYAYGVAGSGIGGIISELVAAPTLRRRMRETLRELKRVVEHERVRRDAARRRRTTAGASASAG